MASNRYPFIGANEPVFRLQLPLSDRDDYSEIASVSGYCQTIQSESARTNTAIEVSEADPSNMTRSTTVQQRNITVHDLLRNIARKYEISKPMADRLLKLRNYEIVIVCDDSGSMMTLVDGTQRTRWDELRSIVKIVLEVATIFDSNGVDIYFLNRRSFLNIKDPREVDQAFAEDPSGYTPLVPVLEEIFQSPPSRHGHDKKLLVFVATDGIPTDKDDNDNIPELECLMREKRQVDTTFVSFLLCTDDPICVEYLTEWDKTMDNVDVTDDFTTERQKVRSFRGPNYPFTRGDYVVKALVGAIDPEIDALNEAESDYFEA